MYVMLCDNSVNLIQYFIKLLNYKKTAWQNKQKGKLTL